MRLVTGFLLTLLICATIPARAYASDDSLQARTAAADRYLKLYPINDLLRDMVSGTAKSVPQARQQQFVSFMGNTIDPTELETHLRAALIKVFTADELNAMTRFYGSPTGMSVRKKMPEYMAEINSEIQQIVRRAVSQTSGPIAAPSKPMKWDPAQTR